jgi:hypothetical protein
LQVDLDLIGEIFREDLGLQPDQILRASRKVSTLGHHCLASP